MFFKFAGLHHKWWSIMEEMIRILGGSVASLTHSLCFRDCAELLAKEPQFLLGVTGNLEDIEARISALATVMAQEQQALQATKKAAKHAQVLAARIASVQENLPPRLPRQECGLLETAGVASTTQRKPANSSVVSDIPRVDYVRKDEFESVPLNTRGRITCDQINACVDAINTTLAAKYKILATPRAALGEPQMKKLLQFREQETDETRDIAFFVDDDLKTLTSFKLDTAGRTCLLVLRSLKRLRDLRSAGISRHVVCY